MIVNIEADDLSDRCLARLMMERIDTLQSCLQS